AQERHPRLEQVPQLQVAHRQLPLTDPAAQERPRFALGLYRHRRELARLQLRQHRLFAGARERALDALPHCVQRCVLKDWHRGRPGLSIGQILRKPPAEGAGGSLPDASSGGHFWLSSASTLDVNSGSRPSRLFASNRATTCPVRSTTYLVKFHFGGVP